MKRTLVIAAAIIFAASLTPAVSAAPKEPVKKCTKANSKPHVSPSIAQPKTIAKVLPKTFTFITNCGNIVVETVGDKAPQTLTALATLASKGFFNATLCHRLTTQGLYVLQCGDPTYQGNGNPPKWDTYKDENLPKVGPKNYPAGTVAMANPARPNANGSQFFLVYQDTQLGPNYTIWGKITKGLDTIKKIGEIGALQWQGNQAIYAPDGDGEPIQQVAIIKATAK